MCLCHLSIAKLVFSQFSFVFHSTGCLIFVNALSFDFDFVICVRESTNFICYYWKIAVVAMINATAFREEACARDEMRELHNPKKNLKSLYLRKYSIEISNSDVRYAKFRANRGDRCSCIHLCSKMVQTSNVGLAQLKPSFCEKGNKLCHSDLRTPFAGDMTLSRR